MHQGLLAPQFGLGREMPSRPEGMRPVRPAFEPKPTAELRPFPEQEESAPPGPAGGPVVIVRKKRVLQVPGDGPKPSESGESSTTTPAPKEHKVFVLNSSTKEVEQVLPDPTTSQVTATPAPSPALTPAARAEEPSFGFSQEALEPPLAESAAQTVPTPPRFRRRRNPLHAPTLVQHIVFERPPETETSGQAFSEAGAGSNDALLRALGQAVEAGQEYREIRASLQHLHALVDSLQAGHQTYEALDRALTAASKASGRRRAAL